MPFAFRLSNLLKLDLQVSRGTDFEAWRTQWTAYINLSGFSEESAETNVQALNLRFSCKTLTIVNNPRLTTEQKKDVDIIIHAIKNHINGHRSKSMEWHALCWQSQQPGETFDNYLVALRKLAKICNFCLEECAQKSIRDQIIKGISNGDTSKHLLRSPKLTLQSTHAECRKMQKGNAGRSPSNHLEQSYQLSSPSTKQNNLLTLMHQPNSIILVPDVGKSTPGGTQACHAYNQLCQYCHKISHYAKLSQARLSTNEPTSCRARNKITKMSTIRRVTAAKPAPTILIRISTKKRFYQAQVLPDSGVDISAAGQDLLKHLDEHTDHLVPSQIIPWATNGQKMQSVGKMLVKFQLGDKEYSNEIHIYPNVSGVIIS